MFLGAVGALPQMGAELDAMRPVQREQIRSGVKMVDGWVQGVRAALDMRHVEIDAEGGIMDA